MLSNFISLIVVLAIIGQIMAFPLAGVADVKSSSSRFSPAREILRKKRAFDRFDHGGIFIFGGVPRFDNWQEEHGYNGWYRHI